MKRSVIVGAVCAVGLLVGIGVWAWKSSANTVKTEFTQADFLEDYQQLWADFQENYPFLPVLEELGVDVEGIRKSGEDTLKQREITLDGFVWLLKQQFGQMRGLAHLGVVDADTLNVYAQAAETGELTDGWYDITHNPQTVATYERLQQTADGQSTNTEGESQELPQVETQYYPEEKAVYFHFPTFYISTVERDAHVVEDYLDTLGDVDIQHVILDITGNTGGVPITGRITLPSLWAELGSGVRRCIWGIPRSIGNLYFPRFIRFLSQSWNRRNCPGSSLPWI